MNSPSPHASRHVESAEHDSEQLSVQRMSHVAPSEQLTLPLAPTVSVHVEPPEQSTLHDIPHEPLQVLSSMQPSVQLFPAQPDPPRSHAVPASHVHDVPVHVGGGVSLPQAARPTARKRTSPESCFMRCVLCNRRTACIYR